MHPKAILQLKLYTNDLGFGKDVSGTLFALVWQKIVMLNSHEFLYQASKADMHSFIEVNSDDISITWKGYTDSMLSFIAETTKNVVSLPKAKYNDKKKLFDDVKTEMLKDWKA